MSAYRVTFPRVVRAEWTKLFGLRSTWVVAASTAVLAVALAGATGWHSHRADAQGAFLGIDLFSLVLGVFGITMITGEYGSGLVRATFAAVPRRLPVLLAKAVVLAAAVVPLMLAVSVVSLGANRLLAGHAGDAEHAGPAGSDLVWATAGAAAAPVALALIGLGVGALLRHTATAITVYVLSVLVLPALLQAALPERLGTDVVGYVPVAAAQAMYTVGGDNPFRMLAPGTAALVVAAWVVAALAAGGMVLWRRDP
ncbi:ABC transporter permease [Actinoplanes sp. ATCC 53533]|uniref:ABC transporter permease n=1 Tax=Actinoplanes sp. ATCC 53533 TaxID=1288362 RepID=UPI000F77591C|nr:ABC transporter permease [Actinoplanes sp. ATCC 53533]RSM47549.1 ABC transporter permease [Actinoplanes sp. ATCC 53533]